MAVRDHLPINGAGAVNLPDPQEREPEVLGVCAQCGEQLYSGDEVLRSPVGLYWCDARCLVDWMYEEGQLAKVQLWSDGNVIVRGV